MTVLLSGCVAGVVGTAVDSTVTVVKLPFKVLGSTASLVLPDGDARDEGNEAQEEEEQDDD